jgi:glycosyltransferase involved in cell wall biosynthesis
MANGKLVKTTYGLPDSKIQIVYPGIDLKRFKWRPMSDSSQQMVLGYVGRISNSDKGTDFLPKIAQVLVSRGHADFKLKIVGDGPDRSVIQQMVDRLGLVGSVLGLTYVVAGFVIGIFGETEKHAVMSLLQIVQEKV